MPGRRRCTPMRRITLTISDEVAEAIATVAKRELRKPRDQALWLLLTALDESLDIYTRPVPKFDQTKPEVVHRSAGTRSPVPTEEDSAALAHLTEVARGPRGLATVARALDDGPPGIALVPVSAD
jgi:hypothetical protein